jgi:uncharacterized protein (DUF305 family)
MRRTHLRILATAALLALPLGAFAQQPSSADAEFKAAMDKMHQSMEMATSADPAVSYAKKMIAHHQGALDMSEAVLQHTQDATIRKMAEKTMKMQKKDIQDLQKFVDKKGQ